MDSEDQEKRNITLLNLAIRGRIVFNNRSIVSRIENFFWILKQEIYYGKVYYSYQELKQAIINYVDYYNNKRIKQKLGWLSPVEYRLKALAA